MKSNITLDRFDLKILHELQQNGGLSNQELAEKVGLTAAPCSRRVKQLEESGVIQQRVVRLDERALSLDPTHEPALDLMERLEPGPKPS